MLTTPWITRNQIAQYKQISKSVYDDKLNQIVLESQFMDLLPLMGERFYNDFNEWFQLYLVNDTTQPNNVAYTALYEGSTYTYSGVTYTNYGIVAVLANYVYARYAMFSDVIDNPFGMVNKLQGAESQPISMSTKQTLYKMNQDIAFNYWTNVRRYIIRNSNSFPLFQLCEANNTQKPKLYKIGSHDYNKHRR